MIQIQKKSSNHIILDSGSFLTYSASDTIQFDIQLSSSFSFKLMIIFSSDDTKQHSATSKVNDNTIEITCINFDSALGTGLSNPIELATFEGKKIYFNFWAYLLGEHTARKVVYSLYQED